jgi:hypothetical protein
VPVFISGCSLLTVDTLRIHIAFWHRNVNFLDLLLDPTSEKKNWQYGCFFGVGIVDNVDAVRVSPAPIVKDEVERAGLKTVLELTRHSKTQAALKPESNFDPEGEANKGCLKTAVSRPPAVKYHLLTTTIESTIGM